MNPHRFGKRMMGMRYGKRGPGGDDHMLRFSRNPADHMLRFSRTPEGEQIKAQVVWHWQLEN